MFEKIIIIKDFDGYAEPKIKNVKLTRVNGYLTKITREGEKEIMTEEYKLKNLTGLDAKKILECADYENVDIQRIIDFINKEREVEKMNQTNDEKRFSKEEIIVEKYIEKCKSQGIEISYRDAVVASLDRTEPVVKQEFTEEQKKEKEDLKAVENFIKNNPGTSYKNAVRIVLNKEEISLEEKVVEEYIEKNNCSYREAVLAVLPLPKKEE